MIEKYLPDFFFLNFFNKIWQKNLNWINRKIRELKWTKVKLKDCNEFWRNLDDEFCILAYFFYNDILIIKLFVISRMKRFSGKEQGWIKFDQIYLFILILI